MFRGRGLARETSRRLVLPKECFGNVQSDGWWGLLETSGNGSGHDASMMRSKVLNYVRTRVASRKIFEQGQG